MKVLVVIAAICSLSLAQYYNSALDSINVEAVVMNPVILNTITKCFLSLGPCTDPASFYFKLIFPNLIQTSCAKCSPAQKHLLKRYFQELERTSPNDLKAFKNKYDPKSKYMDSLKVVLNMA